MTLLEIAILRAKTCKFQPSTRPPLRTEPPPLPPSPRPPERPPVITLYEPEEQPEPVPESKPLPTRLTVEMIKRAACEYFGVSEIDMISARRTRGITRPRQVAMYLAKENTVRSLPEIGARFGGKDHTTVLHAWRQIAKFLDTDEVIRRNVSELQVILDSLIQPPQVSP